MRPLILLVPFCLILTFCTSKHNEEFLKSTMPTDQNDTTSQKSSQFTYLALGDSYTIGEGVDEDSTFPAQLFHTIKNPTDTQSTFQIIAQTGWRSDNLINAIEQQNPDNKQTLVSLLIGVNNQYQKRPISQYETEFKQLLVKAIELASGKKSQVFVLSIPDYGVTPFGAANEAQIYTEINQYNSINKNICDSVGVTYFDITDISREAKTKPELLASDQLHPSATMYKLWVNRMFADVRSKLTPYYKFE